MKVLFFKAPWCAACHALEQFVPKDVVHIDCNEDPDTATRYNISGLPVFIAVKDDGNEIARITTNNMGALGNWITKLEDEQWQVA